MRPEDEGARNQKSALGLKSNPGGVIPEVWQNRRRCSRKEYLDI
jgi:hypothetical protein